MGRCCVAAFILGLLSSALAWSLPLRTSGDSMTYDALFTLAFFTRVYLLPVAAAWVILGFFAILSRRWWVAGLSVCLSVAWASPELWAMRSHPDQTVRPTFSVASFNLNKDLKDATAAIEIMRSMDADFIVCQEVSPRIAAQLQSALKAGYPHAIVCPNENYDGAAIFSRTPMSLLESPTDNAHRNLTARATAIGREFTLVGVHLASPQTMAKRRTNREQIGRLLEAYGSDAAIRDDSPVILIGDFNFSTLAPQAFALSNAGLTDAYRTTGGGRQTTWPSSITGSLAPRARIDTAYVRGFTAIRTEVGAEFGSDHRPIRVLFATN